MTLSTEEQRPFDEPLSHGDATRWHMTTPENPMVIAALLFFDGRLSLRELDELIRTKLLRHRRFRQHVAESRNPFAAPRWRADARFDPTAHIAKVSPGVPVDETALASLVSRQLSEPMHPRRSPWRFDLVDLTSGDSALFVRVHHCIADGTALVGLLEELAEARPVALKTVPVRAPAPVDHTVRAFVDASLYGAKALRRWLTMSDDSTTRLRGDPCGEKQLAWSPPIAQSRVKAIAAARGYRMTDVLLAGVAGSVGRHLVRDRPSSLPLNVRALLPLAAQAATADELGNHYASVLMDLPVGIADPVRRLDETARRLSALRAAGDAQFALDLAGFVGVLPARVERRLVQWFSHKASLVVSNLPGPKASLCLAGRPLRSIVVWAPAPGRIGSTFTLFGYAGDLRLGVETDAAVIGHPADLVKAFALEIDELGGAPGGALAHA